MDEHRQLVTGRRQFLDQLQAQRVIAQGHKRGRALAAQRRVDIIAQSPGAAGGVIVQKDRFAPAAVFKHFAELSPEAAAAQHQHMGKFGQNRHHKAPFADFPNLLSV